MKRLIDLVLLSSGVGSWGMLALEIVLRATLVLAAAGLACACLRRSSAAVRHMAWAVALTAALVMPALTLALPTWRIPVLLVAGLDQRIAVPAEPTAWPVARTPAPLQADRMVLDEPPAAIAPVTRRFALPTTSDRSGAFARSWAPWLAAVWGVGAVAVLGSMLVGQGRLQRLRRRSTRLVDGPWVDLTAQLGASPRLWRRVVVLRGDGATSPMTWGVLRPLILVPAGAEEWPRELLRDVLLHELAHVKRCDCLTQLVAQLACALYWFHPLAWAAARRLMIERERACDDLVLQSGSRAADYAGHLLEVARALRAPRGLAAAAAPMARDSQIEGRLRAILDGSRDRRVVGRRGACLLLAAATALILPISSARLSAWSMGGDQGEKVKTTAGARSATMIVSGRVLDGDGRPAAGARVAVVGRRKLALMSARAADQYESLGGAHADADGRFRLETRPTSNVTHFEAYALALAPGFGLGWAELDRDAESPSVNLKLRPEQVVEGRLTSERGAPASDVEVQVESVGVVKKEVGGFDGLNFHTTVPAGLEGVWPQPTKTDAHGRFRIAGLGRGLRIRLLVQDPRFARQRLSLETDMTNGPKQAALALQPAFRVTGRVTCADSGEPLRGAIVQVGTGVRRGITNDYEYRTDADGRYAANSAPGKYLRIVVYPPAGSPYLIVVRDLENEAGVSSRKVDLGAARGVLLTGRITERGSGRPLAGSSVYHELDRSSAVGARGTVAGWMAAVPSGADGRYAIAVPPGKGCLFVYGPTADYVHQMMGSRELAEGKPGGRRLYAHAIVPFEVKPGPEPRLIDVPLQRGVTLVGRVVGPAGQAVQRAEIITVLTISPYHTSWRGDFTIPVRFATDGSRTRLTDHQPDRGSLATDRGSLATDQGSLATDRGV